MDEQHTSASPRTGVLAMQGAFAEHRKALSEIGAEAFEVRTPEELERCDALVIPGGESTAIRKALARCGLLEPLARRISGGMPTFGTCAGLILLGHADPDGAPPCLGLLDVDVERNGWGRQVHSAELTVELADGTRTHAAFIRAPRITRLGADVEVLVRVADGPAAGEPVAVRQGRMLAAVFHPELGSDRTLHARLLELAGTPRA